MKRVYLDYAATTPTHPEVVKAMLPYFTESFSPAAEPKRIISLSKELLSPMKIKATILLLPLSNITLYWRHAISWKSVVSR